MFKSDANKFVKLVNTAAKVPLSQNEFDALVSYSYNAGPANTMIGTKLIRSLNAGDYYSAGMNIDINRAGGRFLQGLENRRIAERNIYFNAIYINH